MPRLARIKAPGVHYLKSRGVAVAPYFLRYDSAFPPILQPRQAQHEAQNGRKPWARAPAPHTTAIRVRSRTNMPWALQAYNSTLPRGPARAPGPGGGPVPRNPGAPLPIGFIPWRTFILASQCETYLYLIFIISPRGTVPPWRPILRAPTDYLNYHLLVMGPAGQGV